MSISVKRNSKEFKEIKEIISDYREVSGRKRWILLYSLKPYHALKDAVLINKQKEASVLYELAFDSLHDYFLTRTEKLYRDEKSGIYYFKRNPRSKWMEAPFSFKGKLKLQVKKVQEKAKVFLKKVK